MKTIYPIILSLLAALGNAMVAYGQKKATTGFNPYWFGAGSLLIAAISLLLIGFILTGSQLMPYWYVNIKWIMISAMGFVLLNVFLTLLYTQFGTSYYILYSTFAILTTSIGLAILIFKEKINLYYCWSVFFAIVTIYFFIKGKSQLS